MHTRRITPSSLGSWRSKFTIAVALGCFGCADVGDRVQAAPLANVGYTVEREFEVEMEPQPVSLGRVSASGVIYLVDISDSAVVAYTRDGKLQWRTEIAPEQAKRSPVGIEVDPAGNILVLESYASDVHVLDPQGQFVRRIPLAAMGSRLTPRPSGMLAVGRSGELHVLSAEGAAVQQLDSAGQAAHRFGAQTSADDARAGGWLRIQGETLYHRRAGTVTFDLHAADGRLLRTISPPAIPYHPRSSVNQPGDQVFTTDLLPDGRIVCEIAHRTPYEGFQQGVRTAVTVGVYIIGPNGDTSLMLPKGIGQLAAADLDGALYFLETRVSVRPGERPQLRRVVLQ